jgi:hypothetical protein
MALLLHCGAESVNLEDLLTVPLPKATKSYQPVGHYDLANMLNKLASSLLPGFTHLKSEFGLARYGQQMFGVHTYKNTDENLGLSIGFRNSYDRTLSIGIAAGASVFVCDNLALTGDITVLRKHTLNVQNDIEQMAISTIFKSRSAYYQVREDAEIMQDIPLTDNDAYRMLGLVYGHGIISPRQVPVAKKEWLEPSHSDFQPRSLWSCYNAITESLKTSPPRNILEKHLGLHRLFKLHSFGPKLEVA